MFYEKFPQVLVTIYVFYALLTFLFFLMTTGFVCNHWENTRKNITSWEIWNGYQTIIQDPSSSIENIDEIFGKNQPLINKICLCDPFKGMTNDQLVEGYKTYYDYRNQTNASSV